VSIGYTISHMKLQVNSLSYKHKLNNNFCLGPISVNSKGYLKVHGDNGSGKTTFLKCLAGIYKASAGEVNLAGEPIKQVIWVGAEAAIYWDSLTAKEYIILTAELYGVKKQKVLVNLQGFKLDYLEQNVFSLSTGQKKIVSIVASIIAECPFVVMDEPDSNLDKKNKDFLYNLILEQSAQNKQFFLFSSHEENTEFKNVIKLSEGAIC